MNKSVKHQWNFYMSFNFYMVFRFDFTLYPWKHGGHLFHRSSNSFPVISASEEVRDLLSPWNWKSKFGTDQINVQGLHFHHNHNMSPIPVSTSNRTPKLVKLAFVFCRNSSTLHQTYRTLVNALQLYKIKLIMLTY